MKGPACAGVHDMKPDGNKDDGKVKKGVSGLSPLNMTCDRFLAETLGPGFEEIVTAGFFLI